MTQPSITAPAHHLWFWPGVLMMTSRELTNSAHVHFPASLYVALEKPLTVSVAQGQVSGQVVLVRANAEQAVDSYGGALLDVLIDADSDVYRYLEPLLKEQDAAALDAEAIAPLNALFQRALNGDLDCASAWDLVEKLIISLCAYQPERSEFDPRIANIAKRLRAELPVNPDLAALAEEAGVSESRFMHLFKQQYGLPMRQYLLWARLRTAAQLVESGSSLTDIAVDVGFYDQAHFARTVRRMFDFSPSFLANPKNLRFYRCDCL